MRVALCGLTKQVVARFCAEMRYVHNGCRVSGAQAQNFAGLQRGQPFAGFQHGKRAKQPGGIKVDIKLHAADVGLARGLVHGLFLTFVKLSR